jgi:hypothetical protein
LLRQGQVRSRAIEQLQGVYAEVKDTQRSGQALQEDRDRQDQTQPRILAAHSDVQGHEAEAKAPGIRDPERCRRRQSTAHDPVLKNSYKLQATSFKLEAARDEHNGLAWNLGLEACSYNAREEAGFEENLLASSRPAGSQMFRPRK